MVNSCITRDAITEAVCAVPVHTHLTDENSEAPKGYMMVLGH